MKKMNKKIIWIIIIIGAVFVFFKQPVMNLYYLITNSGNYPTSFNSDNTITWSNFMTVQP